jgi:hypothetical protein
MILVAIGSAHFVSPFLKDVGFFIKSAKILTNILSIINYFLQYYSDNKELD